MRTIDTVLTEVPAFEGLAPEHLELMAGCATNVVFHAGDYLFHEGEDADTFYVLRHGAIALEVYAPQREPLVVETIHPGGLVGWSWLFPPYHWHFDARATELVRAVSFDGRCLREKCDSDHDLGYELMRRFAAQLVDRLQATRLRLLDVYGVPAA